MRPLKLGLRIVSHENLISLHPSEFVLIFFPLVYLLEKLSFSFPSIMAFVRSLCRPEKSLVLITLDF